MGRFLAPLPVAYVSQRIRLLMCVLVLVASVVEAGFQVLYGLNRVVVVMGFVGHLLGSTAGGRGLLLTLVGSEKYT